MLGWNSELTPPEKCIHRQYQSIPVVGGWFGKTDGNFETFIRLNPDIIFEANHHRDPVDVKAIEERQTQFGAIPLCAIRIPQTFRVCKIYLTYR